jgi:two-component system chemotaxis response regulator CheY
MATILVIDDIPEAREIVGKMLVRAGHTIIEAANGLHAQKVMKTATVDLIVTDILMPEMEGLETIRYFRKILPGVPIIVMTGSINSPFIDVALKFGAAGGLFKPFKQAELLEAVQKALPQNGRAPTDELPAAS